MAKLAYLRAGLVGKAAVAATQAKQDSVRSIELQRAILSSRALNAFDAGHANETIVYLDQLTRIQRPRSDLLVLRAYANLKLNRRAEAKRIFEALAATGDQDAIR
jgi:hypothetical protein